MNSNNSDTKPVHMDSRKFWRFHKMNNWEEKETNNDRCWMGRDGIMVSENPNHIDSLNVQQRKVGCTIVPSQAFALISSVFQERDFPNSARRNQSRTWPQLCSWLPKHNTFQMC